jgi:hypothetical protein
MAARRPFRHWPIGVVCAGGLLLAACVGRNAEPTPPEPVRPGAVIRPATQFRPVAGANEMQETTLLSQPLPTLGVHLEIRSVVVPAGREVSLPIEYDGVLEVRTGSVSTIADGQRQARQRGEIWQVARQSRVVLQAGGELAVLRAVYVVPEPK